MNAVKTDMQQTLQGEHAKDMNYLSRGLSEELLRTKHEQLALTE